MKRYTLLAVVALALTAVPAAAQVSVYGAGGVASPTGDDMDGVEAGLQLLGGVNFGLNDKISLYAEGRWGTHDIEDSETTASPSALMGGLSFSFADEDASLRPWVDVGAGIQTLGFDTDSADPSDSTFGYQVAFGVGFDLFGLGSGVRASYEAASFDADSDIGELDFAIFSITLGFGFPLGGS